MDCCQYTHKLAIACGLVSIPYSRRTFDRRLKTISTSDIKERISILGNLFVTHGIADPSINAIDSNLLKAKGHVWHKSSMKKGIVPCLGIDTDARWWGYSHTKKWIFRYKLHLTCTIGKIVVPLTADVTTANVQENKMYACSFKILYTIPVLQYIHKTVA